MKTYPASKSQSVFLLAFFSFLVLITNHVFAQAQRLGDYSIPKLPEWSYNSEKSSGDYFIFQNSQQKIELAFKKEPVSCANLQEFNKLILVLIQNLQKEQWIMELRKPAAPYSFAGQKSCHFMKLKSKTTGQQKFILNPQVKTKMYQIEVYPETASNEPPLDALNFISQISTDEGQAIAVKNSKSDVVVSVDSEPEKAGNDLSGFSKVKTEPNQTQMGKSGTIGSGSAVQTASSSVSGSSVKTSAGDTRGVKPDTQVSSETVVSVSETASGGFDFQLSDKAATIPDGDEQSPVINPVGTVNTVGSGAGWALGLAQNPKPLLDALSGDRPGGDVQALMALLRQTQGPFSESEDQAMMKQYAPYANSGSAKASKGIRSQSELLLQAMIHRQIMMQAAWEYDFALSQNEMAELMADDDEKEISSMLAEIQQMIMQDQSTSIEKLSKQSETVAQIPTPAELIEEQQSENSNATEMARAVGAMTSANSGAGAEKNGENKDSNSEIDAMVSRYFALREEHRMLNESCNGGNTAACNEATAIYREAMDIRKKLEAKGIDVLNYKKPETKTAPEQTPVKEEPLLTISKPDPNLTQEQNQAIAEHEYNIISAQKTANSIRREMAAEKDPARREELRLQALHMDQNAHDSKDLIESIRTGTIVKTRGPWDEHSAVVLAETSRKLREDFQRASQMQASYVRMLNTLKKNNPAEAEKFRKSMTDNMIKGIFDPGGFAKAEQALNALYVSAKGASQAEQKKLEAQQGQAFERLAAAERNLRYIETLKSGCDKAIFVGTLFTGMAPGLFLSMAYEGACTGVEKGPKEALKNMAVQGATMLAMAGVMKAGSWGINKLLNPKVVQSEVNSFKKILEANKYQQEMEWNRALVNQLKDKAAAFEKCKATGGKNYVEIKKALDEAVSAANSSSLAKRIMKNELTMLENQIKSGATRDYSKLKECLSYQKVFDNRLQKSIYPRADAEMIKKLRSQGYNVEGNWFQEYRNACSRGVNADRDMGLLASFESKVTKNGQPVSMGQFMDEAQKAYDQGYKAVTGRSAKLADQSITTSAHSESFPVSWLQKKMEGPFTTLDPPVTPQDFEKAGKAIYNKVQNALAGPDPAFVNMKKACASLSKDLKTKVLDRLKTASGNAGGSPASRQAALKHWEQVQKVMDDFASDKSDPLTTMKKLQQLTGSTSVSQSASEVRKLLTSLGG